MKIKRMLVPVDFSPTSLKALDHAIALSALFKAELLVLFVVEPVYYAPFVDLDGTSANLQALLHSQRRAGREQLTRLAARLEKRQVRYRTRLRIGQPWAVIVEEAKTARADLIVMATHGWTGFRHFFMGSVTEKVVRRAACPVLTLHASARTRQRRSRTGGAARA